MFRKLPLLKRLFPFTAKDALPKTHSQLSLSSSFTTSLLFQRNTKNLKTFHSVTFNGAAFSSLQNSPSNHDKEDLTSQSKDLEESVPLDELEKSNQANIAEGMLYSKRNEGKKALEIFDSVLENDDKTKEISLGNAVLTMYREIERLDVFGYGGWESKSTMKKAQKSMKKALEFAKKDFGEHSEQVFYLTYQLAKIFAQQEKDQLSLKRRITEALPLAEKSLEIALNAFPKESKEVGQCYQLLSEIHLVLTDFTKSLEFCQKAVEVFQNKQEEFWAELAETYFVMAQNYFNKEEHQKAEELFSKMFDILLNHRKEQWELRWAQMSFDWGKLIKRNEKKISEAKVHLKTALSICNSLAPLNKIRIAEIKLYLGKIAQFEGKSKEAVQLFKESKAEMAALSPLASFQDARSEFLSNVVFGTEALNEGNFDESMRYLKNAVIVIELYQLYLDPRIQKVYYDLGRAYEGQGSLPAAWLAYSDAYYLNKKHLGKEHAETVAILEKLEEVKKNLKAAGQEDVTKVAVENRFEL